MDARFDEGGDGRYDWAVIGAGPAGIAAVGQLIDAGANPGGIVWIDPSFTVGDFGAAWRLVISNTPVETFLKYFQEVRAFQFSSRDTPFDIEKMSPQVTCPLVMVATPLQWITERLKSQVATRVGHVVRLMGDADAWCLTLASGATLHSRKVILAIGAEPRRLAFANLKEIPLTAALDPMSLRKHVQPSDHVAVFGDAQSARSALQNLQRLGHQRISHFYRSQSSVVRHLRDVNFAGIRSMPDTAANLLATIPHCTKAIYAAGFKRRFIQVDGLPGDFGYDSSTGIIAPGLFGLGIAFPEIRPHELGKAEYRVVAIWPILKHLQHCMPLWSAQEGLCPSRLPASSRSTDG